MVIEIENSGFWEGILAQIPRDQRNFENSQEQHAVPKVQSGGLRAMPTVRRNFQNPRLGDGDLGKILEEKIEFCSYFLYSCLRSKRF